MTDRSCSTCLQTKPTSQFDSNGRYVYSVCKDCKKLREASRKYGLTCEQAHNLYSRTSCMCCGQLFGKQNLKHIHHTCDDVKGIVCQGCNHILGQETQADLDRVSACLRFVASPRKNLFNRDNPQGSLSDPSTITRRAQSESDTHKICRVCSRWLPIESFRKDRKWYRGECRQCAVYLLQARLFNLRIEDVFLLRQQTKCDCCSNSFTKRNFAAIHHVGDRVLGVVCDACNRALGQETPERIRQLEHCAAWIRLMMI